MNPEALLLLSLATASFGYAGYQFIIHIRLMRSHQSASIEHGRLFYRLLSSLVIILGQKSLERDQKVRFMHAAFFWSYVIMFFGTLEQFANTLHPSVNFEFIGMPLYRALIFLQDIASPVLLLAIIYACYRRLFQKPIYLENTRDSILILVFLGLIVLSDGLTRAFRLMTFEPWFRSFMPVAQFLSGAIATFDLDSATHRTFYTVFKWMHLLTIMSFAMYIPRSKHLHILTAVPNVFLRPLSFAKGMTPINIDDLTREQFGAAKITDLTWKDSLDYFACVECGRCESVCPAFNTSKPLSSKRLIVHLRENLRSQAKQILAKDSVNLLPIIGDKITVETIWSCTTCRACETSCPVSVSHTDKIYELRRNLVMMEGRLPGEAKAVLKNISVSGNPWGFDSRKRLDWADGLSVPTLAEWPTAEYVLWVGCAGAYNPKNQTVVRSLVTLLKKAGVDFAVLGNEEHCTGDAARRFGDELLFQIMAKKNIATLNDYHTSKIITTCPHCYNSLKNDYPSMGGNYRLFHHSEFIASLIDEGRLESTSGSKRGDKETVTVHDSCYLGRWNGIFDAPRTALESFDSYHLVEMKDNREQGLCCGAGGGCMWMEETGNSNMNMARVDQALETGADIIATSCPFCAQMLGDGIKAKGAEETLRVMDIAEMLVQTVEQ